MDGKAVTSPSTSLTKTNRGGSSEIGHSELISPNGVAICRVSDTLQPLHIRTSPVTAPFLNSKTSKIPTSEATPPDSSFLPPVEMGRETSVYPTFGMNDHLSAEEMKIRALCEERLDNAVRRSSFNVPTFVVDAESVKPSPPLIQPQASSPIAPSSPLRLGAPTLHGITTERTKRRLSGTPKLLKNIGRTPDTLTTNPDFDSSEVYASVGTRSPEYLISSGRQAHLGLSPIGSVYSIDQSRHVNPLMSTFETESVPMGINSRVPLVGNTLTEGMDIQSAEQDVWSVGSVNTSSETSPWSTQRLTGEVAERPSYTSPTGKTRDRFISPKYASHQRFFADEFQPFEGAVRVPLSSDSSTMEDTASLNMNLGTARPMEELSLPLHPHRIIDASGDPSTDPRKQSKLRRGAVKQKSVRWARRPSESPSPSLIAKFGPDSDVRTPSESGNVNLATSRQNPNSPAILSPRLGPGIHTLPMGLDKRIGDYWRLHSAKPVDDAATMLINPTSISSKSNLLSPTSARLDSNQQLAMMPAGPNAPEHTHKRNLALKQPTLENNADLSVTGPMTTKSNKWNKLRKLRQKLPGQRELQTDKDNWGTALEEIKRHRRASTFDGKRLLAMSVLGPKETEYLIETLQSLRESIELSNARLEWELREIEPVSMVRMRRQAYHMHSDSNAHRISMPTGRGSRSRGTRHDFARRSGGHRRADEVGQNREEKVEVEVRVVFLKIGEIDTLKEFYYADAFIQAKWREPKLDERTTEELTITELEQFWNPLLYIDNILSETKETQWMMAQRNDLGEVYLLERRRIKGLFLETLELNDFPLDVQDLTITVTTERPDTEVDIIPDQNEMSAINSQTFVDQQEWKLHEHVEITKRIMKQEYSSSMKSHPCLSVTCRAARRPGYFYWNVFLIMFMISGLAFATFAVSPDKAELRLRLSFTLILTSVTFKYVITQSLPKISYLTYMDKYVLMSLAILCIISVWHAIVTLWDPDADSELFNITQNHRILSQTMGFTAPTILFATNQTAVTRLMNATTNAPRRTTKSPWFTTNQTVVQSVANQSLSTAFPPNNTKETLINTNDTFNLLHTTSTVSSTPDRPSYSHSSTLDENMTWLVSPKRDSCSRTNRMACEEWQLVQQVEQHVFTSFVIIYVAAHAIFIFWLYFDASRRRREMRQKDKDYRKERRKNRIRSTGVNSKELSEAT